MTKRKTEAPGPALPGTGRARIRELKVDDEEEREARENNQWRRSFSSDDWVGGVGGGEAFPHGGRKACRAFLTVAAPAARR